MPHRFYVPDLSHDRPVLEGSEWHHLVHVLRIPGSEEVELFDGLGKAARAVIVQQSKKSATLQIVARLQPTTAGRHITLASAIPKGDRSDWLIEKAVELGVSRFVPLQTERSVVSPRDSKLDKLRLTVIAATKQCGRNRLMEISPLISWGDFLTSPQEGATLLMAHPDGELWRAEFAASGGPLLLAIGPEGGWTDAELAAARESGARLVGLGANILRIETAALALATLVSFAP